MRRRSGWGRSLRRMGWRSARRRSRLRGRRRGCGSWVWAGRRWGRGSIPIRSIGGWRLRSWRGSAGSGCGRLSSGLNTGLNEIALPSLQPGSSIMPGKINPVLAELAAMVGFQVVGNDTAVAMAVQAGQLELNVMMPTMAYSVLQSVSILTNALRELDTRCVRGIMANVARCEFYAQSTVALATALNPYIGYAKAAELVKESVATGRSVIEIAREKGVLSEEQIREILDVGKMTGA